MGPWTTSRLAYRRATTRALDLRDLVTMPPIGDHMLLTEIDHVAIAVHDLDAAIAYYESAFGARHHARWRALRGEEAL